jgi:hypothetical protein
LRRFLRPPAQTPFGFTLRDSYARGEASEADIAHAVERTPVADIFARSADQWFATRAALLADVGALTHAWPHRRWASVDATQQAIQQMAGCQNPGEMPHIHQKSLSGVFSRVTDDIAAFNTSISSIAKGAMPISKRRPPKSPRQSKL